MQRDPLGACRIKNNRQKLLQIALLKAELPAAPSRYENQSGGLLFDQTFDERGLLGGQFSASDANVTQKDHVVFRDGFLAIRESR